MFLPLATVALLASALVQAIPAPVDLLDTDVGIRDLELEALLKRDHNPLDLLERSNEERNLEDGVLEARTSKSLNGLATFDTLSANTLINGELGYYGGLYWGGFGVYHLAIPNFDDLTDIHSSSGCQARQHGHWSPAAFISKRWHLWVIYCVTRQALYSHGRLHKLQHGQFLYESILLWLLYFLSSCDSLGPY